MIRLLLLLLIVLATFVSAEETSDGEYLPIVKVSPQYPRRALAQGMVGWVIVEFVITEQGTVRDPFVVSNCGYIRIYDHRVSVSIVPIRFSIMQR